MDPSRQQQSSSVSNLVPIWDELVAGGDGGGSFEPAAAASVVERVVEQATVVEQAVHHEERPTRLVTPPESYDATEPAPRRSAYQVLDDDLADTPTPLHDDLPHVDYDLLRRREIAKELLRARLVRLAEQREHRSAYEIAFILLAASVAILLAAPPLVQVLLAARGVQV